MSDLSKSESKTGEPREVPTWRRTVSTEHAQFSADTFRLLIRPRKSLAFIKTNRSKSIQQKRVREFQLESVCRPIILGREMLVPAPICELIVHIEQSGLISEGLYHRPSDIASVAWKLNYSSMFETVLSDGPNSFDHRSASLLARKLLKAVKHPFLSSDNQTKISKAIDDWNKGTMLQSVLVNAVRQVLDNNERCYKDTLSLLCVHLSNVARESPSEKSDLNHLVESFASVLKIKDKLLKFFITNAHELFDPVDFTAFKSRRPSTKSEGSMGEIDVQFYESELKRKDALLAMLLTEVSVESNRDKEELLWTVQREITQIKRKLKKCSLVCSHHATADEKPQAENTVTQVDSSISSTRCDYRLETSHGPSTPPHLSSGKESLDQDDDDDENQLYGRHMLSSLVEVRDDLIQELNTIRHLEAQLKTTTQTSTVCVNQTGDNLSQMNLRLVKVIVENEELQAEIEKVKQEIDQEENSLRRALVELK